MSSCNEKLSIGDWVLLTKTGAKVHRDYHKVEALVTGAAIGAVLLPLALPGTFLASVGVASGGAGIAVSGATQAAIGASSGAGVLSFITSSLENHPEAVAVGRIKDIKRRWWGKSGYDYEIYWWDGKQFRGNSRHLGEYLIKTEPPYNLS